MYRFKCNLCGKGFTDPTPLRQHTLRHKADPSIRPFKCHLCDLSYMLELHLKAHIVRVHETEKIKCDLCNKELGKTSLDIHMLAYHSDYQVECPICEHKFSRQKLLEMHMRRAHDPNKKREFKCQECDKAYTTKPDLQKHVRYNQDGERPEL